MPRGALDAVRSAIDTVAGFAPADLARCATALVDAAGVPGAALIDAVALEPVAQAGTLPHDVRQLALAVGHTDGPGHDGALTAIPVDCPQTASLVLVADLGGDAQLDTLVRSAAHQLGLRLELVDTRRRLEAAEVRTETLASATQALSRTLELQEVFATILGQLQLVVPYDSASVQHLEGNRLQIIGGHGFPNLEEILDLGFDLTSNDNPNGMVIEGRQPVILAKAPDDYPAFKETVHMPAGISSWLGVPLEFGDRVIGMLSIDSREPDFYDEGHARIAQAFAAQAAIAIENARLFGEMRRMATHDALTGLPNRRHLEDVGVETVTQAEHHRRPVALLMLDLDCFKVINDTHGHAVGDEVLCEIALRVRDRVRPQDIVARFGGEEFVILLPDTDIETVTTIAERLRVGVAHRAVSTAAGDLPVTISIGAAAQQVADTSLAELMRQADHAMYAAKDQGRNQVVVAAPGAHPVPAAG